MKRRATYVVAAIATILIGLFTHMHTSPPLSIAARDVIGDALWAMMMVWWVSALLPSMSLVGRGAIAYGICALVEFSQLLHTSWLDALRHTFVGHLVLGSGFDSRDLLAYAGGVLVVVAVERSFASRRTRSR